MSGELSLATAVPGTPRAVLPTGRLTRDMPMASTPSGIRGSGFVIESCEILGTEPAFPYG
jgi:hypothetical protein